MFIQSKDRKAVRLAGAVAAAVEREAEQEEQEDGEVVPGSPDDAVSEDTDEPDESDTSATAEGSGSGNNRKRPIDEMLAEAARSSNTATRTQAKKVKATLDELQQALDNEAAEQEVIRRIWRRTVSTRPVSVDTYDKNKCGLYLNIACLVEGGAFTKLREDAFNGKLGQTVRGWEARAREHGNGEMGYENLHWVPDPDPYDDQEQEERFLKKAEEYALHLLTEQGYKRTGPTHEDFTFPTAEERETRTLEAMEKAMKAMCDQRNQVVYDAE